MAKRTGCRLAGSRKGYIPSGWRTTPVNRRNKVRAGSRVSRAAHRNGVKLKARGEAGMGMLDLLHALERGI